MAVTAGELDVKVNVNTKEIDKLKTKLDGVSKQSKTSQVSFKKLAGSFLTAQAAMAALQFGLSKAVEGFKYATKSATDLQESQSKLKYTFSDIQQEANKTRDALVNGYGLSKKEATELLGATGDLLTGFGFTQEKSLELSDSVQQLSVDLASFQNLEGGAQRASEALTKALLGETESAKALGIVIRAKDVDARIEAQGKKNLTGLALERAKSEVRLQIATEQSQNALGDYARTQDQLANRQRTLKAVQEDVASSIGSLFLPVMNQVTGVMLESAKSFRDFLADADKMEKIQSVMSGIGAGFSAFGAILKDLGTAIFENVKSAFKDIVGSLGKLFTSTKNVINPMNILSGAMKILSIGIGITIKFIKLIIQGHIDWIRVLLEVGKALAAVFMALLNPTKWGEAKAQLAKIKMSFGDMAMNAVNTTKDMISDVVDGFKTFPTEAKINADKYNKIMKESYDKNLQAFKDMQSDISKEQVSGGEDGGEGDGGAKEPSWVAKYKEGVDTVKKYFSTIADVVKQSMGIASEAISNFYDQQTEELSMNHEMQIEAIDERLQRELELLENNGMTKSERLNAELMELQDKLAKEKDLTAQKDLAEAISGKQKEIAIMKAKDQADQAKRQADKKYAKEKHKMDVEQFKSKQALDIANVWMSAASGIVSAWASAATWPFPTTAIGIAMAGVLTGLIMTMAGVQTGLIASQKPPPPPRFQAGTTSAPGGMSLIGERGAELMNVPSGASITPAKETKSMLQPPNVFVRVFVGSEEVKNIVTQANIENRMYEANR